MSNQVITAVGGAMGAPILNERLAAGAILPGHLVIEASGTVAVNATADAAAQKLFAQCNQATAGDVTKAYATGETVSYGAYHAGQEVYGLVAAGAASIADGAPVTSAGDGTLKIGTASDAVGYAKQLTDNSGGASAVRILIRVA